LAALSGFSYWPRLIVTDADRHDDLCPPECREDRSRKSYPEDLATCERLDREKPTQAGEPKLPTHPQRRPELARRLRFVFLSQQGLLRAAGGADEVVNSERCALLGSAYKRLAALLSDWLPNAGTEDQQKGFKQALEQAARWYEKGEGHPNQSGFSPYCAQNRLALQAVLGSTGLEEAALALQAGEIARQRYAHSRDYFDLIMAADGVLIARLMDGSLLARPDDAEREILGCYRDIRERLPETERKLDSALTQIRLLATFVKKRAAAEAGAEEPAKLAERLRRIADLLEGKLEAPDRKQPISPASSSPSSTTAESAEASPAIDADVSSGGSTAVEESSGERPTGSSAKARRKRPE
jgi:hypothetical protein